MFHACVNMLHASVKHGTYLCMQHSINRQIKMFDSELFKKKTVVVTGSSSGIGAEIARTFARAGANVVIHGRGGGEKLDGVSKELTSLGTKNNAIHADFSEPDFDAQAFVALAWRQFESIDVWINNAGGDVLTGDLANASFNEKLKYLLTVDVESTLSLSRAVGTRMKSTSNTDANYSIINIGWDQAWIGMAGDSGDTFAATKGAIMASTKSLAHSFAPEVRVNCIAPGWIKTEWGQDTSEYWDQRARRQSLMKRWGTPQDVASAAVFLASPAASFISGQVVNVNGGFDSYPE